MPTPWAFNRHQRSFWAISSTRVSPDCSAPTTVCVGNLKLATECRWWQLLREQEYLISPGLGSPLVRRWTAAQNHPSFHSQCLQHKQMGKRLHQLRPWRLPHVRPSGNLIVEIIWRPLSLLVLSFVTSTGFHDWHSNVSLFAACPWILIPQIHTYRHWSAAKLTQTDKMYWKCLQDEHLSIQIRPRKQHRWQELLIAEGHRAKLIL